jgi:hypothetical protein
LAEIGRPRSNESITFAVAPLIKGVKLASGGLIFGSDDDAKAGDGWRN